MLIFRYAHPPRRPSDPRAGLRFGTLLAESCGIVTRDIPKRERLMNAVSPGQTDSPFSDDSGLKRRSKLPGLPELPASLPVRYECRDMGPQYLSKGAGRVAPGGGRICWGHSTCRRTSYTAKHAGSRQKGWLRILYRIRR